MSSKVDGVIESVGALGRFQWIQTTITGFNSLAASFHFLVIVFHSITPKFRCAIDVWGNDSYAPFSDEHNQSIHQWIPTDKNGDLDSCAIYASNSTNNTVECTHYVYDHSEYWGTTLNMEFGMVCSQKSLAIMVKEVFTIGLVVGALLVGILADRIGRKPSVLLCLFLGGASGVVAAFSVNVYMYAALRFVIAVCFVGLALVDHIIGMECTGPSGRTYMIAYRSIFWPIGTMIVSPLAYYLQDWNLYQLVVSLPPFVMLFVNVFFLYETPHYLLAKGKHKELEKILKKMGETNQKMLPENSMEELKEDEEEAVSEKFTAILHAPVLLRRFAIFLYLWFIAGMSYYGLSFNVANLTGNIFVNNAISGAVELPAGIFTIFSQKLGRKLLTTIPLFVGGAALIGSALMVVYLDLTDEFLVAYSNAQIVVSMIGKLGISTVFLFDYFWASELFPSTLRTTMLGFCSTFARIGTILSPVIADLYKEVTTVFDSGLGPFIFGIAMVVGGFLSMLLPETNKQKIPETIKEANNFMTKKQQGTVITNNAEVDQDQTSRF